MQRFHNVAAGHIVEVIEGGGVVEKHYGTVRHGGNEPFGMESGRTR